MNRRGVEFSLMQARPGLWSWRFQIGETVTSGKTEAKLKGLAVRRVQQRIDRELNRNRARGPTIGQPGRAALQIRAGIGAIEELPNAPPEHAGHARSTSSH
jgi:hypothetical protein